MKKKTGFTLAEVLITLAIIGIIAALVLPAVLNNFQFRAVGTRLSKFMTTVENSTRAYVETEGALDPTDVDAITNYVRRTFSMSNIDPDKATDGQFDAANLAAISTPIGGTLDNALMGQGDGNADANQPNTSDHPYRQPYTLKDGTAMNLYLLNSGNGDWFPGNSPVPTPDAIGRPALGILFSPSANALPNAVRRTFGFVITDLGYVFPAPADGCTWSLFNNRWSTRPDDFATDTACADKTKLGDLPEGWTEGPRTADTSGD